MSSFNVKLHNQAVERVSKLYLPILGITLDENLRGKEHADAVCIRQANALVCWPESDNVSPARHRNVYITV